MSLSVKTVRKQLSLFKPLLESASLEATRRGQNKLGELMAFSSKNEVIVKEHAFENFTSLWLIPHDERRKGIILYLHGGGYTSGDIEYAKGFASVLAVEYGTMVFAPAYRLAPEHPFPSALDDAYTAYNYLLDKGYSPDKITLVGESAGGGLCYALLLRLRENGLCMPAGVVALSPWTDLCMSGSSYKENEAVDPTMTLKTLRFYASSYTDDPENPLASPLYADLTGMPPSLIYVGGDEIMKSDAEEMHSRLKAFGCDSELIVKPERWHAYLLYGLVEDKADFSHIGAFLGRVMSKENKLRWMPLDNAAKIYPAARRRNWSTVFRVSVTLKEKIDRETLQSALDVTLRRFPSIAVKLKKGFFWYYLEQISASPAVMEERSFPLYRMSNKELSTCAFRVLYYENRIAFEVFHSLTDGTGAMIFLKTLAAEYISQKYSVSVTAEKGVLPRLEEPSEEEIEDSFFKYAGKVSADRHEKNAWHLFGTPEKRGYHTLTCFKLPLKEVSEKAREYKVSVNTFLVACLMEALADLQKEKVRSVKRRKPIKVLVPVNLRRLFPSRTLRNFAFYTTPEIDTRLGEYTFEEICESVTHRVALDVTPKQMSSQIAYNVNSEKNLFVKIMPLFIKNAVMKAVFDTVGEKKSCITMSNLGKVDIPDEMKPFVERFDFILGVQATAPNNSAVVSYGDYVYFNFIRNTTESELEMSFHRVLQKRGIKDEVESNTEKR